MFRTQNSIIYFSNAYFAFAIISENKDAKDEIRAYYFIIFNSRFISMSVEFFHDYYLLKKKTIFKLFLSEKLTEMFKTKVDISKRIRLLIFFFFNYIISKIRIVFNFFNYLI